jgi:hypothetical protein
MMDVAVDSSGRFVTRCWSGSDRYCEMEAVSVDVV